MRDNGGAAACGGAAGAAGARDGCALFRFASFLNNAALAHAIGALWPALYPRAQWAGPPVWGWSSLFRGWSKQLPGRVLRLQYARCRLLSLAGLNRTVTACVAFWLSWTGVQASY